MPDFTPQQTLALETRGASIALNAGAGCGKTFVLAQRLLAEIAPPGGRSLSRLVALTFTKKAARELRQRVRGYCRDSLNGLADAEAREPWKRVIRSLESPPIGTFHTFCGEILRRFPIEAGIDPGFLISEGPTTSGLRDRAIDAMLRDRLIARDPDLRALAIEGGLSYVQGLVSSLLDEPEFGDLCRAGQTEPSETIRRWFEIWERRVRPSLVESIGQKADVVFKLLEGYDCSHHATMHQRRETLLDLIPRIRHSQDVDPILEKILEQAKIQGGGTKPKWPDSELYERFGDALSDLRDSIKAVRPKLVANPDESRGAAEKIGQIIRLGRHAVESYQGSKRDASLLDYNDLLIATRDLLRNRPGEVREVLEKNLDLILIDEFQDTDPIQEEIVRHVAGADYQGGRVFIVGDVKQSIYSFRGARPELFTKLQAEFPEAGRLPLNRNFRSLPGILHFVNALFERAFAEPYQPLLPKPGNEKAEGPPPVVFLWSQHQEQKLKVDEGRKLEGRRIATYLRGLIDSGRIVRDRATGENRPMTAGDVAILFRAMTDLAPYERALAEEGLDYHVVGGKAFYAQQEITDLANVLTVIENPHNSVALAGVLRSPFFALSDEALFWLVQAGEGDGFVGLRRACEPGIEGLTKADREKALRAYRLLTRWRSRKDRDSIATLVDSVLVESGFEAALIGESLGDRKRANARKLVRLARQYDSEGGLALADFADRLRADLRRPPKEGEAATTDEAGEVVRLLSIHQSKGLEFPVVIVPDINRSDRRPWSSVAMDPDLGLVLAGEVSEEEQESKGPTKHNLGWLAHRHLAAERDKAEALRLFYVATTRARDLLILSSASAPDDRCESPAMRLLDARFERSTGDCFASLPDEWPYPEVEVVTPPNSVPDRSMMPRRVDLLSVARAILETPLSSDRGRGRVILPTVLDLDLASKLGPRLSKLDRLLRDVLRDMDVYKAGRLDVSLDRACLLQSPKAPDSLRREAASRLEAFLASPLGRSLARANTSIAGSPWSKIWKSAGESGLVIQGTTDLLIRSESGDWGMVGFSLVEADESFALLRLQAGAALSGADGREPVSRIWSARLGDGGGISEVPLLDDSAILEKARRLISRPVT